MTSSPSFDKAKLTWTLLWDPDWVTAVTFLGLTRRLAAGNQLGQILLWDLPEKPESAAPPPRRLDGHDNAVSRLVSTPDGRWLVSASYDHTIRYWDMAQPASGKEKIPLNAQARAEAIRHRSSKVPALMEAEVELQQAARVLHGHRDWILGLGLSGDGRLLASGDDAREVVVWDRADAKELRRWKLEGWAYALAMSPDATALAVSERVPLVFDSGRQAAVKLWDPTTGKLLRDLTALFPKEHLSAAAFSPDGKLLALARGGEIDGTNGKVTLVDPAAGKKVRDLTPGHLNGGTDVAFHPDGKHLASAGRDTVVRIWRVEDGKLVAELGKPRGGQFKDWIHALSFSADGRWLAAADMAGQVQVWHFPG